MDERSSAWSPGTSRSLRLRIALACEIVSVGDSVGINLWGHASPLEVTMDEMLIVCKAVRRGNKTGTRELRSALWSACRKALKAQCEQQRGS